MVVNPCPEALSGNFAQRDSFLRCFIASASVDDFVVVKVDIDGGTELEIAETIAQRPEFFQTIDDFFLNTTLNSTPTLAETIWIGRKDNKSHAPIEASRHLCEFLDLKGFQWQNKMPCIFFGCSAVIFICFVS